jgi:hypothetical protein
MLLRNGWYLRATSLNVKVVSLGVFHLRTARAQLHVSTRGTMVGLPPNYLVEQQYVDAHDGAVHRSRPLRRRARRRLRWSSSVSIAEYTGNLPARTGETPDHGEIREPFTFVGVCLAEPV